MSSTSFPNLCSKITTIHEEFLYKLMLVKDQCQQIRKLLQPYDQVNKKFNLSGNVKECDSRRCESTTSRDSLHVSALDKDFHYKNIDDLLNRVVISEELQQNTEEINIKRMKDCNSETEKPLTVLGHALKDGIPVEIRDSIQEVSNYINLRTKPSKSAESAKKKFVINLEKNWREDFDTFMIFEHDLGESIQKYLSVIEEKIEKLKIPARPDPELVGPLEIQKAQAQNEIKSAQCSVNEMILKDLSCIDTSQLNGKNKKDIIIAYYHLLKSLRDLKQLKSDFIISGWFPDEDSKMKNINIDS